MRPLKAAALAAMLGLGGCVAYDADPYTYGYPSAWYGPGYASGYAYTAPRYYYPAQPYYAPRRYYAPRYYAPPPRVHAPRYREAPRPLPNPPRYARPSIRPAPGARPDLRARSQPPPIRQARPPSTGHSAAGGTQPPPWTRAGRANRDSLDRGG